MTTRKTMVLMCRTLVGKLTSQLFNTLSTFVIAFLLSSKHLLISCLQSPTPLIFESKEIKSATVSIFFLIYFPWSNGSGCYDLNFFFMLSFRPTFPPLISLLSRGCLVPLHFVPLVWYHLHIWGYWYFSQQSWFQFVTHPAQYFAWCTLHRG